jgi:hypothetical protein
VRTLLTLLPALACGAVMLVCVRMMMGRHGQTHDDPRTREIAELRDELARLRAGRALQDQKEKING